MAEQPIEVDHAVPEGPASPRFRRWLAVLVGIAAVAASMLSYLESNAGRQEEHNFVIASRGANDISVRLAATSPLLEAEAAGLRQSLVLGQESLARRAFAPSGIAFDYGFKVGPAQERASDRLLHLSEQMTTIPDQPHGLDPRTYEVLQTEPSDFPEIVAEQNEAVDTADFFGTRQQAGIFGLGLLATAAGLLGLAGLMGAGRPGWVSLISAASLLALALLSAAVTMIF